MKFTFKFELLPAGLFGLPEEGRTIIPSDNYEIVSPVSKNFCNPGLHFIESFKQPFQALLKSLQPSQNSLLKSLFNA